MTSQISSLHKLVQVGNIDAVSMVNCGKSFYWATIFLPRSVAKKVSLLYSLCRVLDDLADGNDPDREAKLFAIAQELSGSELEFYSISSELVISRKALKDLLSGLCFDQGQVRIKDEQQLLSYCYKVAGTVGIMMCDLMQVKESQAIYYAIHLGIALQLTNIARDVGEDDRLGRQYVPTDWLADVPKSDVNIHLNATLCHQATKQILSLADTYYESGLLGLRYLPRHSRFAIYLAAFLYRAIGYDLKKNDYNNISYRAHLTAGEKFF